MELPSIYFDRVKIWLLAAALVIAVGVASWQSFRINGLRLLGFTLFNGLEQQLANANDAIAVLQDRRSKDEQTYKLALALAQRATAEAEADARSARAEVGTLRKQLVAAADDLLRAERDRCASVGLVWLLDSAISGSDPARVGKPTGDAALACSGYEVSEAAKLWADNFAIANGWRKDLLTWQGWAAKNNEYSDQTGQ